MKTVRAVVVAAVVAVSLLGFVSVVATAEADRVALPDPQVDDRLASAPTLATIVVAGGCFWGIEDLYQHVKGVSDAVSGYAGGSAQTANYDLVSMGNTGHAEAVKVTYDPSQITYGQLLKIFFSVAHDPTQRGGQGPDIGPQYRSAIFHATDRQQQIAKAYIEQLTVARSFAKSITTHVAPLTAFYEAEAYHQNYVLHHPTQSYIVINDLPKLHALRTEFPQLYVK